MIKYFVHESIACGHNKKKQFDYRSRALEHPVLYTTSYNPKYVSDLNNSPKFDKL